MKSDTTHPDTDLCFLFQRVKKLEKENTRMRRIVLSIALVALGLFTMGQARQVPKVVPKVIEAEKFVLRDATGTEKAKLFMTDVGPELKIIDVDPKRASSTSIGPGTMHMFMTGTGKDASMVMGPGGVSFALSGKDEEDTVKIFVVGPTVQLSDKQGFQTTIGVTNLETPKTGETRKTSAASIVVFDKDKTVIWKAPVQ